jgi:hypothetical protein
MKLKEIDAVEVGITVYGKIILRQTTSEENFVYLTLDQFRSIQKWVDENIGAITYLWNDGVVDEVDEDDDNG